MRVWLLVTSLVATCLGCGVADAQEPRPFRHAIEVGSYFGLDRMVTPKTHHAAGELSSHNGGTTLALGATYRGVVPSFVEFGWRRIGNYATFSVASTTAGLSFAS